MPVIYSDPKYATLKYQKDDAYRPETFLKNTKPVILKIFETAPRMLLAQFSDNGGSISVQFSTGVDLYYNQTKLDVSQRIPCGILFEVNAIGFAQLASNNTSFDCTVIQTSPINLNLKIKALFATTNPNAARPGDLLKILPDAVFVSSALNSDAASGSIIIQMPKTLNYPILSVVAPAIIPSCAGIPMDMSATQGEMGRRWALVQISFTSDITTNDDNLITTYFESIGKNITAGKSTLKILIPGEILIPRTYSISITFGNYLGAKTSTSIVVVKSSNDDIPLIMLTPANQTFVSVNQPTVLLGQVIPGCIDAPVEFQWNLAQNSTLIPNFKKSFSSIVPLASYSLEPSESYTFEVFVGYLGHTKYNFTLTIYTTADKLAATAGSSRLVGTKNKLIFSAVIQSDGYLPKEIEKRKSNPNYFQCLWTCQYLVSGTLTGPKENCLDQLKTEELNQSSILSPPTSCTGVDITGRLNPGIYAWNVEATNLKTGSKAISQNSYVEVVDGVVPGVTISLSEFNPGSWSPTFFIKADVDSTTIVSDPADLLITWDLPKSCDFQNFMGLQITTEKILTDIGDVNLKFVPGVLVPETSYCVEVQVADSQLSTAGRANALFLVRGRPENGYCTISTAASDFELESFKDFVNIDCMGWTTDEVSYPLKYEFSSRVGDNNEWSLLASASISNSYSQVQASGKRAIKVRVVDSASSPNDEESDPLLFPFEVYASKTPKNSMRNKRKRQNLDFASISTDVIKALDYISTSILEYSKTGDGNLAQQRASIAADALPGNLTSSNDLMLQEILSKLALDLVTSGNIYVDYDVAAPWFASFLTKISGTQYNLTQVQLESLYNTMSSLISQSAESSKDMQTCFSSQVSTKLLAVANILLGSLASLNQTSSVILNTLNETLYSIETCISRTLACNQMPFSVASVYIERTIGVQDVSKNKDLCGFIPFGGLQQVGVSGCFSYSCGKISGTGIYPKSNPGIIEIDISKVTDLTIRNQDSEELKIQYPSKSGFPSGGFTFKIQVPDEFQKKYGILQFQPSVNLSMQQISVQPVCVSFYSAQQPPSTTGCEIVSIDSANKLVTLNTSHLTGFALGVKQIVLDSISTKSSSSTTQSLKTTTLTSSNTTTLIEYYPPILTSVIPVIQPSDSNNAGAIVGGVLGGLSFIVGGAGLTLYILKKRRENQRKLRRLQLQRIAPLENARNISPRRDPSLLPKYQLPPTYLDHMRSKDEEIQVVKAEIKYKDVDKIEIKVDSGEPKPLENDGPSRMPSWRSSSHSINESPVNKPTTSNEAPQSVKILNTEEDAGEIDRNSPKAKNEERFGQGDQKLLRKSSSLRTDII
ncbi:hypothetical protein HK098_000488 [Nowakowskiella sp. JEL0407]|nr:hypothetical protein HK098_000488 [Nowakowskiella sp. JEL0407]